MMRRYESIISSQLHMMRPGESVTFTRPIRKVSVASEGNRVSQLINSYMCRRRPGCEWKLESFTAITHAGNLIAGVVVTLVAAPPEASTTEDANGP